MTNSNLKSVALRTGLFPYALRFVDLRLYAVVGVMVVLGVAVPWACHYLSPVAGATFLPLFFFTLLAGLLFGWRAGLLVGFLAPLASFAFSGMPLLAVLPRTVIEGSVLGLAAGILYGKLRLSMMLALPGAILMGYLALGLAVLVLDRQVSPVPLVWQTVRQGWPGIAVQLAGMPAIVKGLNSWLSGR